MDNAAGLKKMLSHQIQKMGMVHLLDFHPWTSASPTTASSTFPFAADLFGAMRMISFLLYARGLAVASFSRHLEARVDKFFGGSRGG